MVILCSVLVSVLMDASGVRFVPDILTFYFYVEPMGSEQRTRTKAVYRGHTQWVMSIAFSPAGKLLASGSSDGTVRLWETNSGKELYQLKMHVNVGGSVAFSPDGRQLVEASGNETVKVWT